MRPSGACQVHAEKIAAFKVGDANNDGRMVFEEFRRVALKFTKLTAKHQPAPRQPSSTASPFFPLLISRLSSFSSHLRGS